MREENVNLLDRILLDKIETKVTAIAAQKNSTVVSP